MRKHTLRDLFQWTVNTSPGLHDLDEKRVEAMVESMRLHGWRDGSQVLIAIKNDEIIDGHVRLEAARRVGIDPRQLPHAIKYVIVKSPEHPEALARKANPPSEAAVYQIEENLLKAICDYFHAAGDAASWEFVLDGFIEIAESENEMGNPGLREKLPALKKLRDELRGAQKPR